MQDLRSRPVMKACRHPMRLWQSILTAIAALLGLPEHGLAQARSVPETMQIDDQPGYVANPDDERLPAPFQRQMVFYRTTEAPGTIIVHTSERFLYVVQPNSRAIRYGIGVGRDGFRWSGLLKITRKGEWPDWTPPPEMIARQPYLSRFMAGGPRNPLCARANFPGNPSYPAQVTNQPPTTRQSIITPRPHLLSGYP